MQCYFQMKCGYVHTVPFRSQGVNAQKHFVKCEQHDLPFNLLPDYQYPLRLKGQDIIKLLKISGYHRRVGMSQSKRSITQLLTLTVC